MNVTLFQSTLPARGATGVNASYAPIKKFQSTLPARGATMPVRLAVLRVVISIHAPREGSDYLPEGTKVSLFDFNPRSPRGERPKPIKSQNTDHYFNPRSPRGERRDRDEWDILTQRISIHAPREGSDAKGLCRPRRSCPYFNPRSPRGERPPRHDATSSFTTISIHAPREGSDRTDFTTG